MQLEETQPLVSFDALALGLPTKLRFVIDNGGGLVEAAGYEVVTLGRQLEKIGTIVDFAAFDGARLGVSRRHAQLELKQGRWFLTDLESNNGTKNESSGTVSAGGLRNPQWHTAGIWRIDTDGLF